MTPLTSSENWLLRLELHVDSATPERLSASENVAVGRLRLMACSICSRSWAAALLLIGCSGANFSSTESNPQARPPRAESQIEVFVSPQKPERPVKVVGIIEASGDGSMTEAMKQLKAKTAEIGVDGAMDVECGALGTTGSGRCSGKAFVYER